MSKKSYKLTYFKARGRGEFIRLVFLVAGVEFEEHQVDFHEEWPSLKASGIAPFGQLPLLEIKDGTSSKSIMLCQSVAILRYLANEFGLAPETNLEKAFADMVVDAVMDVRAKIRKCRFETDATLKLSYADISFFNFMNSWMAKDKINGYPDELKELPLLQGLYERVRDLPAVKTRLKTRPDTVL